MSLEFEFESKPTTARRRAGMIDAWQVLGSALSDARDIGVYLVLFNLLWFFLSALIVTAPPATAALYILTREMGYRRRVVWLDFFQAMRHCFWKSWRWTVINLAAIAVYGANLAFYNRLDPPASFLARGFWTLFALLWLGVQLYCFPVLLEQEWPSLRLALRNALVLVLRHPVYTLTFGLVTATLVAASIAVAYFWIFFTVALLMYFYNRGVWYLTRLERGEEPDMA